MKCADACLPREARRNKSRNLLQRRRPPRSKAAVLSAGEARSKAAVLSAQRKLRDVSSEDRAVETRSAQPSQPPASSTSRSNPAHWKGQPGLLTSSCASRSKQGASSTATSSSRTRGSRPEAPPLGRVFVSWGSSWSSQASAVFVVRPGSCRWHRPAPGLAPVYSRIVRGRSPWRPWSGSARGSVPAPRRFALGRPASPSDRKGRPSHEVTSSASPRLLIPSSRCRNPWHRTALVASMIEARTSPSALASALSPACGSGAIRSIQPAVKSARTQRYPPAASGSSSSIQKRMTPVRGSGCPSSFRKTR